MPPDEMADRDLCQRQLDKAEASLASAQEAVAFWGAQLVAIDAALSGPEMFSEGGADGNPV